MLSAITFATDAELTKWDSEVVELAGEYSVSLASCRDLAKRRVFSKAIKDGVSDGVTDSIEDDGSARAYAMRDWATLLALGYFWRDVWSGRESAESERKAEKYETWAEEQLELFDQIGWPISGGSLQVVDQEAVAPQLIRVKV